MAVVISLSSGSAIDRLLVRLDPQVTFDPQDQFDTLTWGRRQVGVTKQPPPLKVEFFEVLNRRNSSID